GSLEREKTFFFFEHSGDVDTEWRFSPGGSRSDELSLNDFLRLLWINIPEFEDEINQYLATEDPLDAYNQLLSLIDLGITDEVLTTTELDGRVAEFIRSGGLNGEGGFTQPALSGDLGDGVPTPGVPDPGDSSVILGTDGNDRLKGTAEADLIFGFGGADRINGLDGNDIISGGDGLDHLNGNDGNDSIFGGYRTDRINGGAGDDLLSGDGGNDSVRGGAGDDLLLGVSGNDTLVGEAGSDTFVFGNGDGTDRINDFDPSEDFIGLIEGELIFADISLTQEGKNTILGVSSTGEELAVLVKVSADAISEDNFVTIADISNIDDAI
ncbi:MAG: calcium-binding protein, partial [Cyanobacteria bacterium P01_G01_bin.67]